MKNRQMKIEEISDSEIKVNGTLVFKDANDNWIAQHELTRVEEKAVVEFVKNKDI